MTLAQRNTIRQMKDNSLADDLSPVLLEKLNRTEAEWGDAVLAYLEFRAGSLWRRGKSRYRQSAEYNYYLAPIRLLNSVRNLDSNGCRCAYCADERREREAKNALLWAPISAETTPSPRTKRKPPQRISGADLAAASLRLATD